MYRRVLTLPRRESQTGCLYGSKSSEISTSDIFMASLKTESELTTDCTSIEALPK